MAKIRIFLDPKVNVHKSRHHKFKKSGVRYAPERNIVHDDDFDFNWFYDKDKVKRPRSAKWKADFLEEGFAINEAQLQKEWDEVNNPIENQTAGPARHTLGEAVDRYITDFIPTLSKSSQIGYRQMALWWKSHYGSLTLEEMDSDKAFEAREVLRSEVITRNGNGKGQLRSDSRVNRYMAVLGSIFTACTKQFRWIKFSYATDHMKAPPNPANVLGMLPEDGTRDRESLTPKEIQKLLEVCSENQKLHVATYLALISGSRKEEICSLKRHQIDWKKGEIHLSRADTKNKKEHTIYLVGEAKELLMGLAKAEGWNPGPKLVKEFPKFVYPESEYVFPSRYCPKKRYDMRVPFKEALKKAGIKDFKWHDYRRTVCTHLIMAGVPAQIIKKIQNWNGTEMIEVYEQLNKAQVKQWVKKATKTFMPKQG